MAPSVVALVIIVSLWMHSVCAISLKSTVMATSSNTSPQHHKQSLKHTRSQSAFVVALQSEQQARNTILRSLAPVLASAFSVAALMYPFDLLRALKMANAGSAATTLELLSNFRKSHGIQGFFTQGLAPELARSTWMRLVKFGLFPICHKKVSGGKSEKDGNILTRSAAAVMASIPEAISLMPLEIAKVLLQLDNVNRYKNDMMAAMLSAYRERGLRGFTTGYVGVQYRQMAWTVGYFCSISFFEKAVNSLLEATVGKFIDVKKDKRAIIFAQLMSGFLAGVFGGVLNTPGDTIRTIVQKRAFTIPPTSAAPTFLAIGREIVAARGFAGLYTGFGFKAIHLGGGGALMAFFIPFFKSIFDKNLQ